MGDVVVKEVLEVLIAAAQRGMRSESISGRGRLFTEWKRMLIIIDSLLY